MTDAKSLLSVGPVVGVSADVLVANTEDAKAPVTAEGFAMGTDINLTSLNPAAPRVSAEVLEATARVDSVGGKCVLSSESSVASALVNGTPIDVGANHLDVPIPLVGIVHFNETLGGPNPTSGAPNPNKVTQRALWVQITNSFLQDATGVEEVIVGEAIADFEGGNPCATKPPVVDKRRMTGGGKFADGTTVTHGFVLHCNKGRLPNNLEVNWGSGNKFHLETLTSATCSDAEGIDPGQPPAGFDTYTGKGTGTDGAKAEWTFTDAGEPGKDNDSASILITKNGTVVLDVSESTLFKGNHQAHEE